MTGPRNGGMCSGKGVYIKLSVLLLLSTTIYVYLGLYSSYTMQTFVIGEVMKGNISDIQRRWDKMEGWVQMIGGSSSQSINKQAKNPSLPDPNRDVSKTEVQKSKQNIDMVTKETNESTLVFVPHDLPKKPTNVSKSKDAGVKPKVLLTLFTSWPTKAEKYLCHNNTIRNWLQLKPFIQPVLFTNETLLAEEAREKGWDALPIRRAGRGVPILKHMYKDVKEIYSSPFYAFSNGDILYSDSLIDTLKSVLNSSQLSSDKPIMIVGRRTNVQDVTSEEASSGKSVQRTANVRGEVFTVGAEDYFITSSNYPWKDIPEVVIGRKAYDNWLVLNARKQKHVIIDATDTLVALHQTTKAGNQEGFKADNPEYNHNLLRRMYHQLHYLAGLTSCVEYYTRYHDNRQIQILKRTIPRSCFPV